MINCYKYCNYCEINLTQRIMMFTFEENFYEYDVFDEGSHKGSSYDFTENIKRFYVVKGKNNTVIFDTAHLFDKSISLKAKALLEILLLWDYDKDLSVEIIANYCKVGTSTIDRLFSELKNKGYLKILRKDNRITYFVYENKNRDLVKRDIPTLSMLTKSFLIKYKTDHKKKFLKTDIYHFNPNELSLEAIAMLNMLFLIRKDSFLCSKSFEKPFGIKQNSFKRIMKELQEKEYVEIIRETHIKRDNNNDYVYDSNGNKLFINHYTYNIRETPHTHYDEDEYRQIEAHPRKYAYLRREYDKDI